MTFNLFYPDTKWGVHNFAMRHVRDKGPYRIIEVDTKQSRYFNSPHHTLGAFGKRKFENLIVLANPREQLRFIYL